jgi:hypothetical protein
VGHGEVAAVAIIKQMRWICECGYRFTGNVYVCPRCGSDEIELDDGNTEKNVIKHKQKNDDKFELD